jgi:hypothetical protein
MNLEDPEGMGSVIDQNGWIGVYAPPERHFSCPRLINTLKALLRALAHLYQNPDAYLCMDISTRNLCVRRDRDEDGQKETELNIYRLRDITFADHKTRTME